MKKNIYLYLFIFCLVISIFIYMNLSNALKHEQQRNESLTERVVKLKDSVAVATDLKERAEYFSLEQNLNARKYFGDMEAEDVVIKVRDGLYKLNNNPEGNPLIGYPMMDNQPYRINKIKVINNRWVIGDFTNGKAWGEVFIKYFIEENGEVTYETVETLLHANSMY